MDSGSPQERGKSHVRREDLALITGEAQYTDDITDTVFSDAELAHAAVSRSQYGSAKIVDVDTSEAEALDGVIAVFTAEDLAESDASGTIEVENAFSESRTTEFSMLVGDRVRYTGDAVAVAVAEDRYIAHDAAERIDVAYERREAVTDVHDALAEDAPSVHESHGNNQLFDVEFGDKSATDAAFESADTVVELDIENQRLAPNALEPRSALGDYDAESGDLTVYVSTQSPHKARGVICEMLDLPTDRVRVVTPDVGGGFGAKGPAPKAGEPLAAWCSLQVERPVKWVATRTEDIRAGPHGRDNHADAALAIDEDGTIRGLRMEMRASVGAYQIWGHVGMGHVKRLLSGAYDIPAIYGRAIGALTNTAPIAPYRGAGRPEAIYVVERLVDLAAAELSMDPTEFRRRNFIEPEEFPFETATGVVYDSGNYERAMDVALEAAGYDEVRERQRELRSEGRYLGVGVACFVENTGTPGMAETARVELDASGSVTAYCGTASHGQGHATSFAQVLADELGVAYEDVDVRDGDTADLERGIGTFASRSAPQGASAVVESAREVVANAKRVAADRLETSVEDVEFRDGTFFATGAPDRSIAIQEVAEEVHSSTETPVGPEGLEATTEYDLDGFAFTFGTHVAVVEVDADSGEVSFERYVAVDDCGVQFNPLIVEGQIHGGIAQGVGEAMYEQAVYDDNGTLVTGSLQDYALPRSMDVPELETDSTVTPSPLNPTGAKGTGEGGTIAASPTIVNAVVDALSPIGVTHIDKPLTDETVWRAIRDATEGSDH